MDEVNVLKFDCNNYLANLSLAKSCLDEHCFLTAIGYMRQAISADPSRPEAFNLLGACCELFRRPLEAQKFYRAALALEPAYMPAQGNLHRLVSFHKRGPIDLDGVQLKNGSACLDSLGFPAIVRAAEENSRTHCMKRNSS